MVGVRQGGLEVTDDGAQKAGCQQPRPERTRGILTDRREQSQGGLGRRGHVIKLPPDLLTDSRRPVVRGQTSRLGGISGGAQGVRAHMGNARGLPRGPGGGRRCGSLHVSSGATSVKPPADHFGHPQPATSERPRPGDRVARAAVPGSLSLEQPQHPFRAVRCPQRHDPSVGFTQRLGRAHAHILALD
jgi:hypothetical protein